MSKPIRSFSLQDPINLAESVNILNVNLSLVEEEEECDCGSLSECVTFDPCCVPRGSWDSSCMVNRDRGYRCHPDQGYCCSDKCQFKDLSSIGLSCEKMTQGCPCLNSGQRCECGLLGTCEDSQCVSQECAWLNLSECSCPRTRGHCSTCCKVHNGSCVRAYALAVEMKDTLDTHRFSPQQPPKGLAQKLELCGSERCFRIWFRQWKENGPCVLKTRMGKCVAGRCSSIRSQPVNLYTLPSHAREDRGSVMCAIIIMFLFHSYNRLLHIGNA